MVEALVESGVVLTPLSKYRDFNIRVCRPYNLSGADLREVMDEALRHVGDVYDIQNVVDLARYLLPGLAGAASVAASGAAVRKRRADAGDLLEPGC